MSKRKFFKKLLPILWLRPERALWDSCVLEVAENVFGNSFKEPAMEYGCTDGMLSFILFGGEFKFEFDDYYDLNTNLDDNKKDFYSDLIISENKYIKKNPKIKFDLGITWKEAHVKRAKQLNFYKNFNILNIGEELKEENKFSTIWAPNLFWTPKKLFTKVLNSLSQTLNKNGRLITILPNEFQKKEELYNKIHSLPQDLIKHLDRGVAKNLTENAKSDAEYKKLFHNLNLKVTKHQLYLPSLIGSIYQIGFRPMFPVLLEGYQRIKKNDFNEFLKFKKIWIDTVEHFLGPMCDINYSKSKNLLWHIYELRK